MCPLLHTHWERAVCPVASVTEFTGQAVQASKDTVSLYLPASHETQFSASGPVWPAGHPGDIQSSGASLPAGEIKPAPQLMQVLVVVAPTVVENLLTSHTLHSELYSN